MLRYDYWHVICALFSPVKRYFGAFFIYVPCFLLPHKMLNNIYYFFWVSPGNFEKFIHNHYFKNSRKTLLKYFHKRTKKYYAKWNNILFITLIRYIQSKSHESLSSIRIVKQNKVQTYTKHLKYSRHIPKINTNNI